MGKRAGIYRYVLKYLNEQKFRIKSLKKFGKQYITVYFWVHKLEKNQTTYKS